jgi:hypothetical protein
MAKAKASIRRVHPASIANLFVRGILADIGQQLGGFSLEDWDDTLTFFKNRCAYTGQELAPANLDRDHAVPVNREYAGLHMHGNLVPASRAANNEKGSMTYEEFLRSSKPSLVCLDASQREANINRIHEFQCIHTQYQAQRNRLLDLPAYCQMQYDKVKALYETINGETNAWLVQRGVELLPAKDTIEVSELIDNEEELARRLPPAYATFVTKLGKTAQNKAFVVGLFNMLSQDGYLTDYVNQLLTKQYSKRLKSTVPVLAVDLVPTHNKIRHYPEPIRINDKVYYLSSQWTKPKRNVLLAWLTDEVFNLSHAV